eukprot:8537166-Lingulodinium_polyedra.AAC.1
MNCQLLRYTCSKKVSFTRDALVAGLVQGDRRQEFLDQVEKQCSHKEGQWTDAVDKCPPSLMYHCIRGAMVKAVDEVFPETDKKDFLYTLKKNRSQALDRRRRSFLPGLWGSGHWA